LEEQFYLFWPLIMLIGLRLLSVRRLWLVLGAIAAGSFGLSLAVTAIEPAWAFYSLPTRAWQLALGGLVAVGVLALPSRWPTWLASTLGATGVALIVGAVVVINDSTPFPGLAALLPALGTALVIVAGERAGAITARLLGTAIPRWFGRISYSLYLWHWPLLILVPAAIGHDSLRVRVALALLAIVIAALSTRYIETPFRVGRLTRLSSRRSLGFAGGASLAIAAVAFIGSGDALLPSRAQTPLVNLPPETSEAPPLPSPVLSGPLPANLQPALGAARSDRAGITSDGCQTPLTESAPRDCVYGDPAGSTSVVVFGDSHAGVWIPAIEAIGAERDWRIVPLIKPACTPVDVTVWRSQLQRPFYECDNWRAKALDRIAQERPDIVFFVSATSYLVVDGQGNRVTGQADAWRDGLARTLATLREDAGRVVVIGDTPKWKVDPLECLASHPVVEDCPESRSDDVGARYHAIEADVARSAGVDRISTIDWLCPQAACPLAMDHYLVYRDKDHLTATITVVLAPQLRWAFDHLGSAGSSLGGASVGPP